MGFDKAVHSRPEFNQKKLDALSAAKRTVYKLLLVDRHVTKQREALQRANQAVQQKYLPGSRVFEIGCGRRSFLQHLQSTIIRGQRTQCTMAPRCRLRTNDSIL